MTINWDINLGTLATISAGLIGVIYRLHKSETKNEVIEEIRHVDNLNRFNKLEASHQEIKHDIKSLAETQHDCQLRITETREMVIRLDESHKRRS